MRIKRKEMMPKDARRQLEEAIAKVSKKRKKRFFTHLVERAYQDDVVLIALAKKLLPDLKALDATVKGDAFNLFLSAAPLDEIERSDEPVDPA